MAYERPTVEQFKVYFDRDFTYGESMETVRDYDIERAYFDTSVNFNEDLFSDQDTFTVAYLLFSAHFLVMRLRAASQGVAGQYTWLQASRNVGSVSESIAIPQRILDNPEYAMISKTNYGAQYLMMVLPLLSGQIFTVCGRTNP
jgi:hypothetical protein